MEILPRLTYSYRSMSVGDYPDTSFDRLAGEVLESLSEGCQVIGRDFTYLYVNDAVTRHGHMSRNELLGRTMMECYPGIDETEMFGRLRRCMQERVHDQMENEFTYPDGSTGWFELHFIPVPEGVCILSLDISDRKRSEAALERTEAQLRHAQKMEAVGRLAGGVAHDFNNILSAVLSYTGLILDELPPNDPLREDVEEIQKAGQRAAALTKQLLAFSRQHVLAPRPIDMNRVLGGIESMLRRLLEADVELTLLPAPALGSIMADPGAVEQILLNLAVNARDAMPGGGKLTIETRNVELDQDYASDHPGVRPGPHVMLAVSDTGIGMDEETQARVFEPFFTTKDKDKGTGLGLSTVFGIVKQSGGHICLHSEPDSGATFKVYFPRVESASEERSPPPAPDPSHGSETILLVEDDDQLRAAASSILRRRGYRVLEAGNAGEALLACEQHSATIHLLLTDLVMPRMNGQKLAERLATLRPGMRVLFMSGHTDDAVLQHGIVDSEVSYLQKPITPETLAQKVRQVLGAPSAGLPPE